MIDINKIRLLKSNIGKQLSFLVTLPDGHLIEADVRPLGAARLLDAFDLVEAPGEEQNFQTARVMILEAKKGVPA